MSRRFEKSAVPHRKKNSKKTHQAGFVLPKMRGETGASHGARYGFAFCKACHAVYQKKSWHHGGSILAPKEMELLKSSSVLCPADQMIRNKQYEGELIMHDVPGEIRGELLNLVKGFGERAYERDCQHRIIEIQSQTPRILRVTTTENQLAGKLAKKIKDVFHGASFRVSYSKEPHEVVRIRIQFSKAKR